MSEEHPSEEATKGSWKLWLYVTLAFLVLMSAWGVLILVATSNQPEIPPLP